MIKNDQQLSVTRAQRERLNDALRRLDAEKDDPFTAGRAAALRTDIAKLDAQIAHYCQAASGAFDFSRIAQVETVGRDLVSARIATGMTQEDLAKGIGSKAQQVQRYERVFYRSASLAVLTRVAQVLSQARDDMRKRKVG